MIRLKRSKAKLSKTTPLDLHKDVIRTGNPSLEELDWAIEVIYPEMRAPTFMSG